MERLLRLLLKIAADRFPVARIRIDIRVYLALMSWISDKGYLKTGSIADVAEKMNLSPEQLSFFCSERLGKPFRQIRKEHRIREAEILLKENPEMSLKELGLSVGIPDKSDLRKQFRDVTGMYPSEWINVEQNKNKSLK